MSYLEKTMNNSNLSDENKEDILNEEINSNNNENNLKKPVVDEEQPLFNFLVAQSGQNNKINQTT